MFSSEFVHQNPSCCSFSVPPGTAGFLKVLLDIVGEAVVDDCSYVRFVNAESVGGGCHQNPVMGFHEP